MEEILQAGKVGAAVSGGADSVFLLHHLKALGAVAAVLHVNHQLRGAESDGDEAFVRALAQRLELPVHVLRQPVAPGNMEQEARRARYAFFAECIGAGICRVVATGHTLDDQAETVLSRFLRGAGTAGLSGIRPATAAGVIRPLLKLRRGGIRDDLRARSLVWREDESNRDTAFLRNRLRLEIMPQLAGVNPSLPEVLASTAVWAQGEEEYWAEEMARLETSHFVAAGETVLMRAGELSALPAAVQRRLLRRAVERVRGSLRSIDFRHVEAIRTLAASREGSGRMQLPDLDIYRSFDWLRLAPLGFDSRLPRDFETTLNVPGRTCLPERHLTIDMELVNASDVYNRDVNAVAWSDGPLQLRNWRPGDSYHAAGRSGAEKIKSLFQEYRVPLWERRTWPVITLPDAVNQEAGRIVWTRRFGPSTAYAAQSGREAESGRILLIREAGESNRS